MSTDRTPTALRLLLASFALSLLLVSPAVGTGARAHDAPLKTVGGEITGNLSAPGGAVVEFPLVFLFDADGPENQPLGHATPNVQGDYLFKGLDTGEYKVAFTGRQGLISYWEWYDDVPQGDFDQATRISVVDGQTTSGIDGVIGQAPGGFVEGVVTDLYGRGFDYGFVTAYVFENGSWVESEFQTELTYYDGDYSFPLPSGTYRFLIEAGSFLAPGEALVSEFWPNAATVGAAQDVVVALDQTLTGIDATLAENATGSIAGTVADGGSPVAGVEVRVFDRSLGEQFDSLDVTGASGQFLLEGLWPEEYFVEVYDPLGRYEPTYFGGVGSGGQPVVRIPVAEGAAVTGADISLTADDPATPNGSISGIVTDSTGAPLRGARVAGYATICPPGDPCDTFQRSTRTTDSGFYRLRRLPAGDYTVRFADASGDGIAEFWDDQPTFEGADPVSVVGAAVAGIDAQLGLGGSLEGTVLDVDGEPFELLTVTAYQQVGGGWQSIDSEVELDGDGSWRLSSLPAGDYVLRFLGQTSITGQISFVEFYDDEFSFATADPVTVTAGQTLSGLDAVLGNAAPGGFAGRVTNTSGTAIEGAVVRVLDSRLIDIEASATTDANGDYAVDGLFPGTYYLSFVDLNGNREWWNDVGTAEWATPLDLGTTLQTGFDVELGATAGGPGGGSIAGTVVDAATSQPIGGVLMLCYADDFTPIPSCRTTTAADGSYTLGGNLPSGDYVVLAAPETGSGYVQEYYEDEFFVEDAERIAVTLGASTSGIDLELDAPGTISGTVTASSGSFDRILVDGLLRDSDGDWRFVARTSADTNGDYALDILTAGTYRVRFVGESQGMPTVVEVYDNEATVENGDDVSVSAGGTVANIDAVLGDLSPLVNPSFDGTLDAWTVSTPAGIAGGTSITHDDADRFGGEVSGSARFTHSGSIGETLNLSQCVAADGDGAYEVGAHTLIEGGGPFDPSVSLLVESFASSDCSGSPQSSEFVAETAGTTESWMPLVGTTTLDSAGSVLLTVVVDAGSATEFEAWVDDVYLTRAGFLFGDGFESGALGAWSSAMVP